MVITSINGKNFKFHFSTVSQNYLAQLQGVSYEEAYQNIFETSIGIIQFLYTAAKAGARKEKEQFDYTFDDFCEVIDDIEGVDKFQQLFSDCVIEWKDANRFGEPLSKLIDRANAIKGVSGSDEKKSLNTMTT